MHHTSGPNEKSEATKHQKMDGGYPGLKQGEVSTGTTIVAIPTPDGVVLGADCRVSTGIYAVNRTADKISQLSEHIFCGRSGSAADLQALTEYVRFYLQQLRYVN